MILFYNAFSLVYSTQKLFPPRRLELPFAETRSSLRGGEHFPPRREEDARAHFD